MQTIVRFDMRGPEFGTPLADLYRAALELAEFADQRGADTIMVTEHHGSVDGYLPAPTVLAGGFAARTTQARILLGSVVLPLHNPIEVAEQILVLDQLSGGRIDAVMAAGYVPSEFAMFGRTLRQRPQLLEEGLRLLSEALTGAPVTVGEHTFTVTPSSVQKPRPPLFVAGGVPATARRAARYGDGFYPAVPDPALREIYREECGKAGKPVGRIIDTTGPLFVHVADDPEKAWDVIGPYALYELNSYGTWAAESTGGDLKIAFKVADDVAAARACGLYAIVTPDECLDLMHSLDAGGKSLVLTPLLSGLSPDVAWQSMHLYFDEVLPRFRASDSGAALRP